jgi:hypothetical protein
MKRLQLICGKCGAQVRALANGNLPEHLSSRHTRVRGHRWQRLRCDGLNVESPVRVFLGCPYRDPIMADGWLAFHQGRAAPKGLWPRTRGKSYAWRQGWIKAKLAAQQGKPRC